MKTRIISGIIGIALLFVVVFSGSFFVSASIFLLSLIGIYEFYNAVSNVGYKPIRLFGYLSCLPILIVGLKTSNRFFTDYLDIIKSANYVSLALFLVMVFLFLIIIFFHEKFNIINISLTVFGMLYVPFLFSFVVMTRKLDNGFYYIWLIFIGAFATDTFAYFSGKFFGKRKILPVISPKKTFEGFVGGILGSMVLTSAFGLFINYLFKKDMGETIPYHHFIILGGINGIVSQIGDWGASAIKRFSRVKDYGNLMPGHGGVLDRFDSILFVAPTVYLYIRMVLSF
ncbi:MAG TPA: phosphatidate cytidylyltransferase [Pseudobacteroides sp.]|uniref:phosphatidate cytidylyltransferase n=1 Tax=Pseudobacteroides sp. TaxID=1968840 RepID=UPI002F91D8E4